MAEEGVLGFRAFAEVVSAVLLSSLSVLSELVAYGRMATKADGATANLEAGRAATVDLAVPRRALARPRRETSGIMVSDEVGRVWKRNNSRPRDKGEIGIGLVGEDKAVVDRDAIARGGAAQLRLPFRKGRF